MNARQLFFGLLTATVIITPFATFKPASATDNVANNTVTPIDGQTEMLLMAKGHTSNQSPSNREKHQKGEKAKKDAQINKEFKEAKKKNPKLSKDTFLRNRKN
jgi:hypothetical protein